MTVSVIIVNYNVKFLLEACLHSLNIALEQLEGEVLVIDNHSTDGSLAYLKPRFPQVQFVANTRNTGFAKACNQGLALARGRYILFLNPDTVLQPDSLRHSLQHLQADANIGALGVRMLDGKGRYLKESKRGNPDALTAAYKLCGLTALFPRSPVWARYYLGHLPEAGVHEVEVLCGAFMLMPRDLLLELQGFDESFFMYGEDIDLCYRVKQAGYKILYCGDTTILHYKGESTNKASFSYIRRFYGAMWLFVDKHYTGRRAGLFKLLLFPAIAFRALLAGLALPFTIRRLPAP
ncbi:hypothetical protein GCM10027051_05040 [Niabella terrae]